METVCKTENNNQNASAQHPASTREICCSLPDPRPSTSRGSHGPGNGCSEDVYEYRPTPRSSQEKTHHQRSNFGNETSRIVSEFFMNSHWYHSRIGNLPEEPIDLTCSEKRQVRGHNSDVFGEITLPRTYSNFKYGPQPTLNCADLQRMQPPRSLKRRGRKRKYEIINEAPEELRAPNPEPLILKPPDNPSYLQIADNKQAEVTKAAKSLFSKRTRTLYHWMYPTAPKAQLKAAVASSWETLGAQEKEFYISQVLGRFGFPQTNLMVNPQLGGISGIPPLPRLDAAAPSFGNEETSAAVSTLLMSENRSCGDGPWIQPGHSSFVNSPCYLSCPQRGLKRRGKLGRPPGSKNRKRAKEEITFLKQIREEPAPEEFQDDPELSREFQQFKWNLHLNDSEKS